MPRMSQHNVYSPQIMKLDGYTQFPRPPSKPYCNRINYQSEVSTNEFSLKEKKSIETIKKPCIYKNMIKTRNVQASYLTASLSNKTPYENQRSNLIDSYSKLAGLDASYTERSDES